MKLNIKNIYLPVFGLAIMGLASCSQNNDPEFAVTKDGGVTFTASLKNATRATETGFEAGDMISVYAIESEPGNVVNLLPYGNFADNIKYTYNGSKFESDYPIMKEENQSLVYPAIYPYAENNGPEFTFVVKNDQSVYENYTASDLCTVTTSPQTSSEVNLNFYHRLSHLRLNVSGFNIAGLLDIKIVNALLEADVNLNSNTFAAVEGGMRGDVIPYIDGTNSYKAIIPPQKVEKGSKVIEVSLNGRVFEIATPSDLDFRSGKEYELNVSLVNGSLVLTEGDILNWDEGEAEEEFAENYFSVENGEFVNEVFTPGTDTSDPLQISANDRVLAGGMNYISINCNEEYEAFEMAVKGREGYWVIYPEETGTRASHTYNFTIFLGQELNEDIDASICGRKSDGTKSSGYDVGFKYVESESGDLNINLTFSTPKDVDLHLYTPSGEHIYYADRGGEVYINGTTVTYGLDHDSNPACRLDYLNNENIYIPKELVTDGEYTVVVNLYENCNTSYDCSWTVAARYQGELVTNELSGKSNPATGTYARSASAGDHTQAIKFTLRNTGNSPRNARIMNAKKNVKAPKLTDAERLKIELED